MDERSHGEASETFRCIKFSFCFTLRSNSQPVSPGLIHRVNVEPSVSMSRAVRRRSAQCLR